MLSNKALLVYLSISQWTGRKLDKRATGTVETTHATEHAVGNYTKKLLPGAKELQSIATQSGAIRKYFHEQTLPWFADGTRIISSLNYLDFVREFAKMKQDFDLTVEKFLTAYPQLRADARKKLGDLFSEAEYPTTSRLSSAFQCEISFLPLPDVSDFRTDISDTEKESFLKKMREIEHRATSECWQRLHDVVAKAAARLNTPDAVFRDSLVDNIQDICALLPKLNVTDDAKLETARLEVESIVAKINPDLCRSNATERGDAAKKLSEMTAKMSAFMGFNTEDTAQAKIVGARLSGAKFEGDVGANLADGIITRGDN